MKLNTLTRGHRRLLNEMGFSWWVDPSGPRRYEDLTEEEKEEQCLIVVWLLAAPLEDVRPGGLVATAVKSAQWRRYFEAWQFDLTDAMVMAMPEALRQAGAVGGETDREARAEPSEPCESCQ